MVSFSSTCQKVARATSSHMWTQNSLFGGPSVVTSFGSFLKVGLIGPAGDDAIWAEVDFVKRKESKLHVIFGTRARTCTRSCASGDASEILSFLAPRCTWCKLMLSALLPVRTSNVVEVLFLLVWHLCTVPPISVFARSWFTRFCRVSPPPCRSHSHGLERGSSPHSSLSRARLWARTLDHGPVLHEGLAGRDCFIEILAGIGFTRRMPSLRCDSCTTGFFMRVSSSGRKAALWPVFWRLNLCMGTPCVLLASVSSSAKVSWNLTV